MAKKYTVKRGEGIAFSVPFWKRKKSITLTRATVLTGANGAGKTALLKALAAGWGMDPTGRTKSMDALQEFINPRPERDFGKAACSFQPHEVIMHSPVSEISNKGYIESITDITRLWDSRHSHGEQLANSVIRLLNNVERLMINKDENGNALPVNKRINKFAILLDEPEAALSPETLLKSLRYIAVLVYIAFHPRPANKELMVIVATQHPLFTKILQQVGATRLDMGGWHGDDPFPELESMYKDIDYTYVADRVKALEETKKGKKH